MAQEQLTDIPFGSDRDRSSLPRDFVPFGDQFFFTAVTSTTARELWISDGTPDNTRLVKDIHPGIGSSQFSFTNDHYYAVAGGKLYFLADDGQYGYQVWVTDGTEANTKRLTDIEEITNNTKLVAAGDKVFFRTLAGEGVKLWVVETQGEQARLVRLFTEANAGLDFNIDYAADGMFYFSLPTADLSAWAPVAIGWHSRRHRRHVSLTS